MFQRRAPRTKGQKFREAMWPSMGVKRVWLYYKHRMGRLPGTPEFIARGIANGIAISFTPFIGFHILIGIAVSWFSRASMLAMVLGSLMGGNFWTLPLIWIGTYKLGNLFLGKTHRTGAMLGKAIESEHFSFHMLLDKPMQLLLPMTLGSIPLAIISWIVAYYMTREAVKRYKAARLSRIQKRQPKPSGEIIP